MGNVLITGCSSGFGLLSALHFARTGDHVFATMRDPTKAGPLEEARDAEGLSLEVLELDVTDDASVDGAVKEALAAGPLDVVVNNAGIELRSPVELAEHDEVLCQFDTNVFGLLRVVRAVVPSMREAGAGAIVNVSSVAGLVARPFSGLYAASKHAVEAISEALHLEVRNYGVRVALVEPGQYDTDLGANTLVARRFTPGTDYWDVSERFDGAVAKLTGGQRADPHEVVLAIHEAAYGEPRLRRLVGSDAELIVAARSSGSFEDYEQVMRSAIDWWD